MRKKLTFTVLTLACLLSLGALHCIPSQAQPITKEWEFREAQKQLDYLYIKEGKYWDNSSQRLKNYLDALAFFKAQCKNSSQPRKCLASYDALEKEIIAKKELEEINKEKLRLVINMLKYLEKHKQAN